MKLQFRRQDFQEQAARAVTAVFAGQPGAAEAAAAGTVAWLQAGHETLDKLGAIPFWPNAPLAAELSDEKILHNLRQVQADHDLVPSEQLAGRHNFSIQMETGVGKTYTYIKTIHELYASYGWSKFIIVVPSIAIREGVSRFFEISGDHFTDEYECRINFFIYNSKRLSDIKEFAASRTAGVMIINAQAFNARDRSARRIYMELDEFGSCRPIDLLASLNPIIIIDEPQSVEGKRTVEAMQAFNPLFTLRYSATFRKEQIYNLVFRLDALDAYNRHLVKKIAVTGISHRGIMASSGYVYLREIDLSQHRAPRACIEFDHQGSGGIHKVSRMVSRGDDLYELSGHLEEYRQNFIVQEISGQDNSLEFLNGVKISAGTVIGLEGERQLRRIQIQETIRTHLERERQLFARGIKVLSLFFVDKVANYRQYGTDGQVLSGEYARIFEEEYQAAVAAECEQTRDDAYRAYLQAIPPGAAHEGYFSIDRKNGRMVDSSSGSARDGTSDDVDAYDLIMRNKERLLDLDPQRSPVRFIFSHSALREGWDNPNVFQICMLKDGGSEMRRYQEVGRGLRLCVNSHGERQDESVLGRTVHDINVLTIIANASYEEFARDLQQEMAEAIADRPRLISEKSLCGLKLTDTRTNGQIIIDETLAHDICFALIKNDYIDRKGQITDKCREDLHAGQFSTDPELAHVAGSLAELVRKFAADDGSIDISDSRRHNVRSEVRQDKLDSKAFRELWSRINARTSYVIRFDQGELERHAITALDRDLKVARMRATINAGQLRDQVDSRAALTGGTAFDRISSRSVAIEPEDMQNLRYDLVGRLSERTGLTRACLVRILQGIRPETFEQFRQNPEQFMLAAARIINAEKAAIVVEHITYQKTGSCYETDIFTHARLKDQMGIDAMPTARHLYDYLIYDSETEHRFAEGLETSDEVMVYVKLPRGFYISTPVGRYNPDWAIAFREGQVKHIYFVAETKGSLDSLELRSIEASKITCARAHFQAIRDAADSRQIVYDVVSSYQELMDKVLS